MKKKIALFLILPTLLLSGCISSKNNSEEPEPPFVGGDLIFTEFYVGEKYADRAVEIANMGYNDLDLSKYHINIYRNAGKNPKPTEVLELSGSLSPNQTFVIAYENANADIKAKANLITADFLNDGTFPMTVCNEKEEVVDYLGYPGYFYDTATHSDAVRKKDKLSASKYDAYDWIRYPVACLDNLGNINCVSNDDLYKGPKLTQEDFNTLYTLDGNNGEGGAIEVSMSYTIDGDTTKFNFGNQLSAYGIYGNQSMRYYGINTPEIAHGENPADPYGPEARDFTNSVLNNAKHYVLQSVKGYSLNETYGRMLGYVWITYENNPSPEDYFLLNHYILLNGYARTAFLSHGGYNDLMTYNGVAFIEYLFDAQHYAITNKLNIYSEGT